MKLPIDTVLPQLLSALSQQPNAVLQAAPGAGKTTRVPLALLDQSWLGKQKIIMLEPRRLAARSAALYMASLLGEKVGKTIGYRTRLDSKITATTRIEVVTEGILTRLIQQDPELSGYGLVIFDEFHERNLQGDLGLALTLEAQAALRDDLKILVMSATLDTDPVAKLLNNAPIITSEGRSYPVEIIYGQRPEPRQLIQAVSRTILKALADEPGDLLVFLPGVGEIQRIKRRLEEADLATNIQLCPLYGDLPRDAQQQAINPSLDGQRKIVLATSIAETSLTIEGVRVVIDAGLQRQPKFNPQSGMSRLETTALTQASATQRSGRAGRVAAGVCYRLWSQEDHKRLLAHRRAEIMEADLADLTLELARWGVSDPGELKWLERPPAAAYAQAQTLLQQLGALDNKQRITPHGEAMATLGMHPRLAHMVLLGEQLGLGSLACEIAALLGERDIIKGSYRDADLRQRIELLHQNPRSPQLNRSAVQRIQLTARRWQQQLNTGEAQHPAHHCGLLLAFAYPDRIAQHRGGGEPRYLLSNGRGACFREHQAISDEAYLVIAELDAGQRESQIFLATPVTLVELEQHLASQIELQRVVGWDNRSASVQAKQQRRLGALVIEEHELKELPKEQITQGLIDGIRQNGLQVLPWDRESETVRARLILLHTHQAEISGDETWPEVSEQALLDTLEAWLAPYLSGFSKLSHLKKLNLKTILLSQLSWSQQQQLEQEAPSHLAVPSGSRIKIDYQQSPPVLAARLQELFGMLETPHIAGGKITLTVHLLSPAQRPIQVTQDLASFWANTYQEVKKDLKGRYPKHYWPDDPYQAEATRRVRPRTSTT
ncbi:ATP-dependent helicase HrpB [hydrothermal vent metagenome]|uniref:ATP-dependent helicase HrpB n=1 Tax=hydrothermal vent metagenome TaxID=652676 RepID=A0A3B1A7E0_9ZZZZ